MTDELQRLEEVLDGAALWGLELEPRFRVLAATFEPTADRHPWGDADDHRFQVLCFPVSTILAAFRRHGPQGPVLQTFEIDHLVDVVAAFDGAPVSPPLFDQREPRPGEWGPQFSLEGRSSAPDGQRHTITIVLRAHDLELDLFARFDAVELRGPEGEPRSLGS